MSSYGDALKRRREERNAGSGADNASPSASSSSSSSAPSSYSEALKRRREQRNTTPAVDPIEPKVSYRQNQYTYTPAYTDTASSRYSREDVLRILADNKIAQEQEAERLRRNSPDMSVVKPSEGGVAAYTDAGSRNISRDQVERLNKDAVLAKKAEENLLKEYVQRYLDSDEYKYENMGSEQLRSEWSRVKQDAESDLGALSELLTTDVPYDMTADNIANYGGPRDEALEIIANRDRLAQKYGLDTSSYSAFYKSVQNAINKLNSDVAYYDGSGNPRTYANLYYDVQNREKIASLEDPRAIGAKRLYDDVGQVEGDLTALNYILRGLENTQVRADDAAGMTAALQPYQGNIDAIRERYGIDLVNSPEAIAQGRGILNRDAAAQLKSDLESRRDSNKQLLMRAGYDYDRMNEYQKRQFYSDWMEKVKKEAAEWATDNFGNAIVATLDNIFGGIFEVGENLGAATSGSGSATPEGADTYVPIDTSRRFIGNWNKSASSAITNAIDEGVGGGVLGWLLSKGYSGVTSVAHSLVTMSAATAALGPVAGKAVGMFILGSESGLRGVVDAAERGLNNDEAIMTGIAQGINEALFEELSFDRFLKIGGGWDKKHIFDSIKKSLKDLGAQALVEGSEEVFTDLANAIADAAINADQSEYYADVRKYMSQGMSEEAAHNQATLDFCEQIAESFYGGFVGGGVSAGAKLAGSAITSPDFREAVKFARDMNNAAKEAAKGLDLGNDIARKISRGEALTDGEIQTVIADPKTQYAVEELTGIKINEGLQRNRSGEYVSVEVDPQQVRNALALWFYTQAPNAQEQTEPTYPRITLGQTEPQVAPTATEAVTTPIEAEQTTRITPETENAKNEEITAPAETQMQRVNSENRRAWDALVAEYGKKGSEILRGLYDDELDYRQLDAIARDFSAYYDAGVEGKELMDVESAAKVEAFDVFDRDSDALTNMEIAAYEAGRSDAGLISAPEGAIINTTENEGGAEYGGEQGQSIRDGRGTVRGVVQRSGGQAGAVYGEQTQNTERRAGYVEGRGRQTAGGRYGVSQEARGQRVSGKELGLPTGTSNKNLAITTKTDSWGYRHALKAGARYDSVAGEIEIDDGTERFPVNGAQWREGTADRVLTRSDDPKYTEKQLSVHELTHLEIRTGRANLQKLANAAFDLAEKDENVREFMRPYVLKYGNIMSITRWVEELIADTKANMDRFGVEGAKKAMDTLRRAFGKVYNEASTAAENESNRGSKEKDISYSRMNEESFSSNVKKVLQMSDEDALKNHKEANFVQVMSETPRVILDNVKGAKNLEVIISFDSLYLETRSSGILKGNYHALGEKIMSQLPHYIADPDAIVLMRNGRLNLFAQIETNKGKNGILSVELNTVKNINNKFDKYNLVVTVFSTSDNYVKSNISKNAISLKYEKDGLSQVNPQLHTSLAILNDKPSDDSIPLASEKSQEVISNFSEHGETDRDTEYLKLAQEPEKNEAELQRMVDEAARAAMPDSAMRTPDGKLRTLYHGTNSKKFSVFDNKKIGSANDLGWYGRGFYFAYTSGEASYYGDRIISAYLDIKNPFNYEKELAEYKGQSTSVIGDMAAFAINLSKKFPNLAADLDITVYEYSRDGRTRKRIPLSEYANQVIKVFNDERLKQFETTDRFGNQVYSYEYNGDLNISALRLEYKSKENAEKRRLDAAAKYVNEKIYNEVEVRTPERFMQIIGDNLTSAIKELGYDGIIQSDEGDEAVAFYESQIKSADPVTYDDEGNVIPLSERFNSENVDIRYSKDAPSPQADAYAEMRRQLAEANRKLAEAKGQLKKTPQPTVRSDDARKLARDIIKRYGSNASVESISNAIENLGNLIVRGSDEQGDATVERVSDAAADIMYGIISTSDSVYDEDALAVHKEIRDAIRSTPLYVSKYEKADVGGAYGSYNEFRKRNMGKLTTTNDAKALRVDVFYQEMCGRFPWAFDPDITNQAEQIYELLRVAESELKPTYNIAEESEVEATDLIFRIINDVRQVETYADRAAKRLNLAIVHERNVAANARDRARAKVAKLEEQLREKNRKMNELRKQKNRVIENIREEQRAEKERERERMQRREAEERLLKLVQRMNNTKLSKLNRAYFEQYFGDIYTIARSVTGQKLAQVADVEKRYKALSDPNSEYYDPNFIGSPRMEAYFAQYDKSTYIADMTDEQLGDYIYALLELDYMQREQNRLIKAADRSDVRMQAYNVIADVDFTRGVKENRVSQFADWMIRDVLGAVNTIRRYTGYNDYDPLYQRTLDLSRGEMDAAKYAIDSEAMFDPLLNNKKATRTFSGRNAEEIEITARAVLNGDRPIKLKITPAMRTALYMHLQNDDNMRHIADGGIVIPDVELLKKGKISDAYAKGTKVKFEKSELRKIVAGMSDFEIEFAKTAAKYFDDVSTKSISEVYEALHGVPPKMVGKYFPIAVVPSATGKADVSAEQMLNAYEGGGVEIMNPGWLKERVSSKMPILLVPVDTVVNRAIQNHSRYVGLAIPLTNFNKVWNASLWGESKRYNSLTKTEETSMVPTISVKDAVADKWGAKAVNTINDFIEQISGKQRRTNASWFAKLRSNYAGAVLTLNPATALKQMPSGVAAAYVVGYKALGKAATPGLSADTSFIDDMTAAYTMRRKGYSSQELGELASNKRKLPAALSWIVGADLATTKLLKRAAVFYVRDNFKSLQVGSEAYKQKVVDVYEKIINETQPTYDISYRAAALRSNNEVKRALHMFKTQPYKNFGIVYTAFGEMFAKRKSYREANRYATDSEESKTYAEEAKKAYNDAKKGVARAVTSQAISAMIIASIVAAWDMFTGGKKKYKDEDGEVTFFSFLKGLGINFASTGAGAIPFGSTTLEYAEQAVDKIVSKDIFGTTAYEFSIPEVDMLNNLLTSAADLTETIFSGDIKNPEKAARTVLKDAGDVLQAFGLPLKNVEKLTKAILTNTFRASGKYVGEYKALRVMGTVDAYKQAHYDNLYKAYKNDKAQYQEIYNSLIDDGVTEKAIKDAMNERIKADKGVDHIADVAPGDRYLSPTQRKQYDKTVAAVKQSDVYYESDRANRARLSELAYEVTATEGWQNTAAVRDNNLTATEYILYKLALDIVDEPNKNGEYGTYTEKEKAEAVDMAKRG